MRALLVAVILISSLLSLSLSLSLSASASASASGNIVFYPQDNPKVFDASAYLGLWYDVARTPNDFQDNTPRRRGEELGVCVDSTANYTLRTKDEIALVNTCLRQNRSGEFIKEAIEGRAKFVSGKRGTQLKVTFGGTIARFLQRLFTGGGADYWIYAVGEKNQDGLYPWAIVSGEEKDYIFVLSRQAMLDKSTEVKILDVLRGLELPGEELIFNRDLK